MKISSSPIVFRKGLDLKSAVAAQLAEDYHSGVIDQIKQSDFTYRSGRLTVHLAREFGFCYGVDRAVDYAYQTRKKFPDRRVYLTGEIIHNPHVNDNLRLAGIQFLSDGFVEPKELGPDDVIIIPAFGLSVTELARYAAQGCTLVDTTCGSVLNVWKNVLRYAEDGFTSVIHGKVHHEETRATASQTLKFPTGRYLIVLDRDEAAAACDYIRGSLTPEKFYEKFELATSPGFDPDRDLERVGLANQTTMLMSESLVIEQMFRQAMVDRYGEAALPERFRAFDTICSATQDRQDAVIALLKEHPLDLMLVVGGYNSSNTCNLARICGDTVQTYHIEDVECLMSADELRHRPLGAPPWAKKELTKPAIVSTGWLPRGSVVIGLTAGASTPDNIVARVIERLERFSSEVSPQIDQK